GLVLAHASPTQIHTLSLHDALPILATPLGAFISTVGAQFDHQQIDTSGDAGSLLGDARTNRSSAYFINQLWFTENFRSLLAGRIENVRLDGTSGIFPATLVPPPDNPTLQLQSL